MPLRKSCFGCFVILCMTADTDDDSWEDCVSSDGSTDDLNADVAMDTEAPVSICLVSYVCRHGSTTAVLCTYSCVSGYVHLTIYLVALYMQ